MPIRITDEMRRALANATDTTLRVYDEQANVGYVLVPEAVYERLWAAFSDDACEEARYAHLAKLIGQNGIEYLVENATSNAR